MIQHSTLQVVGIDRFTRLRFKNYLAYWFANAVREPHWAAALVLERSSVVQSLSLRWGASLPARHSLGDGPAAPSGRPPLRASLIGCRRLRRWSFSVAGCVPGMRRCPAAERQSPHFAQKDKQRDRFMDRLVQSGPRQRQATEIDGRCWQGLC